MKELLTEIRACTVCQVHLINGVNPVLNAHQQSKIAIIGQAPGRVVHESGVPWQDKSGDRLREWLNVTEEEFYNSENFAIIPMGFCYPGKGKSGDLPPRPECAPLWHKALFDKMQNLQLILLIGQYAQKYYLGNKLEKNLTSTVQNYASYLPHYFPLTHPSPRNNIWLRKNSWFEKVALLDLKTRINNILSTNS